MASIPPARVALIVELLRTDDIDAALEAGLMQVEPDVAGDDGARALVAAVQQRLSLAWAARARHLARAARLDRVARDRAARRRPGGDAGAGTGSGALPAAAARALERAMARAARKP